MTAITGEHYPHHADSTNTLDLSAVDDVHPTPSIVDSSNARPPHCPMVGPPAFSRRTDSENTPPSARRATSKVRNGIQAATAPRRRARTTGVAHHPRFHPLPKEAIAAAAPELANTPLNYIHDGLRCLGPE